MKLEIKKWDTVSPHTRILNNEPEPLCSKSVKMMIAFDLVELVIGLYWGAVVVFPKNIASFELMILGSRNSV